MQREELEDWSLRIHRLQQGGRLTAEYDRDADIWSEGCGRGGRSGTKESSVEWTETEEGFEQMDEQKFSVLKKKKN